MLWSQVSSYTVSADTATLLIRESHVGHLQGAAPTSRSCSNPTPKTVFKISEINEYE